MESLFSAEALIGLVTLTVLEIVLGIDNIIFISVLTGRLEPAVRARARRIGLVLAMGARIALLVGISWVIGLTAPLFAVFGHPVSGRDLVLIAGGLFLLGKTTHEIHGSLEGEEGRASARVRPSYYGVLVQVLLLDIVFSLDSVITAVGMVRQLPIMVTAVVLAVAVMMLAAGAIGEFVHRHPSVKMLALAFLLLIGALLVAEGFGRHVPRGYVYFAMGFSVFVEMLNLRARARAAEPVHLKAPYVEGGG